MMKTTQKALKELVAMGIAVDASGIDTDGYVKLMCREGYKENIAVSHGAAGTTGLLFRGHKTGTLYAVIGRCTALFICL